MTHADLEAKLTAAFNAAVLRRQDAMLAKLGPVQRMELRALAPVLPLLLPDLVDAGREAARAVLPGLTVADLAGLFL